MATSDQSALPAGAKSAALASAREDAPPRPTLAGKPPAPVIVKLPPPFSVRVSQVCWVLSMLASAASIVYLFIIRLPQRPDIIERIQQVDSSRAEATYETAADILFWCVFGALVVIVAAQVTLQVSFANRRPKTRWWLFGTLLVQAAVYLLARELVTMGDRGLPLDRLLLAALALGVLGLLLSLLPGALRWTARRHDVRNPSVGPAPGGEL